MSSATPCGQWSQLERSHREMTDDTRNQGLVYGDDPGAGGNAVPDEHGTGEVDPGPEDSFNDDVSTVSDEAVDESEVEGPDNE
jgi:hypothetical protein